MAVISAERTNQRRARLLGDTPGALAQARHVRVTPMKARRVVDLIRGLPASEASTVLKFAPQRASEQVGKVLASAVANAQNNDGLDPESLIVAQAFVDEGPTFKRIQPRAQGRAFRIRKRTSHITIVLESVVAKSEAKRAAKAAKPAKAVQAPAETEKSDAPAKKPAAKKAAKATKASKATSSKKDNAEGSAE